MERRVIKKVRGFETIDGAGVKLVRVLGHNTVHDFDPILMLDSFDSYNPDDYTAGFPMHPHRGIETISYVLKGAMQHKDSMGNSDTVGDGQVQWMTAGSGIMHEEKLPATDRMLGVQLWLNLPAKDKMTSPDYHSIKEGDIKEITVEGGRIRLLAGEFENKEGFKSNFLPFDYYDIAINPRSKVVVNCNPEASVMLFTLLGDVKVADDEIEEKTAAKLSNGNSVSIENLSDNEARVLFIASKRLGEEVHWGGPIVMDTREGLNKAFEELRNGNFIKKEIKY